jgi:hypothetical protein
LSLQIIAAIKSLAWDFLDKIKSIEISMGYNYNRGYKPGATILDIYTTRGSCGSPEITNANDNFFCSNVQIPIVLFRPNDLFSEEADKTDKKIRWITDTIWANAIEIITNSDTKFANLRDKLISKSGTEYVYDSDSDNTYDHFINGDIELSCIYLWVTMKRSEKNVPPRSNTSYGRRRLYGSTKVVNY